MKKDHSILFEPIKIGSLTIKNRFAMAAMGPAGMSDHNGVFNRRGEDYYVERAKGGVGLIITGTVSAELEVEKRSQHMPYPRKSPEEFIAAARIMNERIHCYDAMIFAQLTGGFGRVLPPFMLEEGSELVGPSMNPHRWAPEMITREITAKEVRYIVEAFGESAFICKKCGFDGIQIHAVHEGYLIDQFAMSLFNRRRDEYGGTLENRLRFACEIVREIKKRCGDDYPVTLRYSPKHFIKDIGKGALPGESFEEKGRDLEEGIEAAVLLEKAGYDAFDVDVGSYDAWYWSHPPMYHENGMYLPYSELMKKHLTVPVITAGRMDDPDLASSAIREGKTDMIGLARPLLADPYLPRKIKEDKLEEIRPCLSCHAGCLRRMHTLVSCAVNPIVGRESELKLEKAETPKKVLIVGGGVAGCETARVCALRGHSVTIYEKNNNIGGNVIAGGAPDFKHNDRKLLKWYELQLSKLGVTVKCGAEATKPLIENENPDALIIATGSKPRILSFPGSGSANVITAADALLGKADVGKSAAVIGGGLVGCETALWLAKQGREVTIVEMLPDILYSPEAFVADPNELMLKDLLIYHGVKKYTGAVLTSYEGNNAVVETSGGEEERVAADTLIIAAGYLPDDKLRDELRDSAYETYVLGDCKSVRDIKSAIWEAYEVARFI